MTTHKLRYVFDTNTLISAAPFEGSTPDRAVRWALQHGRVLVSPDTLDELVDGLRRGKKASAYHREKARGVSSRSGIYRVVLAICWPGDFGPT